MVSVVKGIDTRHYTIGNHGKQLSAANHVISE